MMVSLAKPVGVVLRLPIRFWLSAALHGVSAIDRVISKAARLFADDDLEAATTSVRRDDLADVIELTRKRGSRHRRDR